MTAAKIGRIIAQVLFFLFMLDATRNWVQWTFMTEIALETFQVSADTLWGINMLKTDMTSGVATSGVFAALYFLRGKQWLPPAMVLVSVYFITRGISLIVDGTTPMLWAGMAYEGVYFLAALTIYKTEPDATA